MLPIWISKITRLFCRKNVSPKCSPKRFLTFFGGWTTAVVLVASGKRFINIIHIIYHIIHYDTLHHTYYYHAGFQWHELYRWSILNVLKISHLFTWFRHTKATLAGTSPCHDIHGWPWICIHQVTEIGQMLLHGEFFKHGIVLWTNRKLLSSQFQICFYVVAINEDLSRCGWCQTNNTIKSCSLSCTIVS